MAILKCHECLGKVSSEADACPHCGAPVKSIPLAPVLPASKKQTQPWAPFICGITALLIIYLMLTKCSGPVTESKQAQQASVSIKNFDESTVVVTTCNYEKLRDELGETPGISWQDQSVLCNELSAAVGRMPSVGLVRKLGNAVLAFKYTGYEQTLKSIAHQIGNVVEARQQKDDFSINETFDTLFKVYGGSNGLVTPYDVNLALRSFNPSKAAQLNQQGIFQLAALIQMEKKRSGQ